MKKALSFLLLFLPVMAGAQVITTIAGGGGGGFSGDGGLATNAQIYYPYNIALDDSGNLYIGDDLNFRVRKVNRLGVIRTICGNGVAGYSGDGGQATNASIYGKLDIAVSHNGDIFVSEGTNGCVRKISTAGIITTVAGTGVPGYSGDGGPATAAQLRSPSGIAIDEAGNLYINDCADYRIRKVNTAGIISTIAGTGAPGISPDGGMADTSALNSGSNIRVDIHGSLFFEDSLHVRRIDASGILTTVAGTGLFGYSGDGGPATAARMIPGNIALDKDGLLYIADQPNHRIRKVGADGIINTIVGTGLSGNTGDGGSPLLATLCAPEGIAIDTSGNVYVSDICNQNVRKVVLDTSLSIDAPHESFEGFTIFPNPSNGSFDILVRQKCNADCNVFITGSKGTTKQEVVLPSNKPKRVDTDLPPGLYFINMRIGQQHYSQELIIQ